MSGPVDVLAVMHDCAERLRTKGCFAFAAELDAARATVAELIEAAADVPERETQHPITTAEWEREDESLGFSHAMFGRSIMSCRSEAYERGLKNGKRLRAALARCRGEA